MDAAWWRKTKPEFAGERFAAVEVLGAKVPPSIAANNSGLGAIYLAKYRGAQRIILLGYDCKYASDGKRHWHGDHVEGLGNANGVDKWRDQFMRALPNLVNVDIINSTRDTALDMFIKKDLESALC